jgi:UDP-N-acetylmuramoyl-L-alanyl-D-glutamate--2,6-diaminopimelate ligase
MAELKDILYKVSITSSYGDMAVSVQGITADSRKVKDGFLFIAVKGTQSDGHQFIAKAIELGASAIVCEKLPYMKKLPTPPSKIAPRRWELLLLIFLATRHKN